MFDKTNTSNCKIRNYPINCRKNCYFFVQQFILVRNVPAGIFLFKVNKGNNRTMSEICLNPTIKTPEQRWHLYW